MNLFPNRNIEEIVRFNLTDVPTRKELTYSAKQLIANEISREKIKKSDHVHKSSDTVSKGSQNRIGFITQKEKEIKAKMANASTFVTIVCIDDII